MIFVRSCNFPLCLFLHKMNFEMVFDNHPVRKQAILNYNIEFTVTKLDFSEEINP